MQLPDRHLLIGMTLGAVCATALGAIGPGYVVDAFADEMPAGMDTTKLVKFDDRDYEINYAPWVSTDPISSSTVKKIEGGKVSYVTIATTATGTYSSDALTSRHVLYPGIDVTEKRPRQRFSFSSWQDGKWFHFSRYNGQSFMSLYGNGVRFSNGGGSVCVSGKGFRVC